MNGNSDSDRQVPGDNPLTGVPVMERIFGRLAKVSGLSFAAFFLVVIAAAVLTGLFLSSRENSLMEANRRMDAAIEAYERGEIDESLSAIKSVRNDFPELKIADYYEGAILFRLEEDRESLERMERFLFESPDEILRPNALFMAGFANYRLESWEEAIAYFEELLSLRIAHHEKRVLPLLGTAYRESGSKEKAEAVYARFAISFPKAGVFDPEPESEENQTESQVETADTPEIETSGIPETVADTPENEVAPEAADTVEGGVNVR